MREDTVLDHVELQLSSPRSSRCELLIAAEGGTEKLACGFLKTFLSHMRAAQELYVAGAQLTLRLEGPQVFNGSRRPWFTKGTLERFVQYVSAPEVLERVKTIEDELAQLEQVRSIQAASFSQVNDAFTNPLVLRAGITPTDYHLGHCQYNAAGNEVDDSKRELLKAMDVRLSALQQEQNMAFSRAAAAGFDVDRIEDLLAFAEFFGADRLRVACNWFCELSAKQQRSFVKAVHQSHQEISSQANVLSSIENHEMGTDSPCRASRVNASGDFSGTQVPIMEDLVSSRHCTSPMAPTSSEVATVSPVRPPQLQGHMMKGLPHRSSPRRRSASPLKKVQVGRFGSRRPGSVVIRSINYFSSHDRPSKERNDIMETSSSDSEDNVKCYNLDESAPSFASSPAAARRLSVQAAINLFESKQYKEIDDAQGKQWSMKQESRRGSLEGVNTSISGTLEASEHGQRGNCIPSSSGLQEGLVAYPLFGHECVSDNFQSKMENVIRSPGRFPCHSNTTGQMSEIDSEGLLHYEGGLQPLFTGQKKISLPREAINLRRGSSTSEDFVASELDSVGSSPLARRLQSQNEHIDSETSNSRSTLTSISQGGPSVDSSFCRPAPSSPAITISSVVHDLQNINNSHKCQKICKDFVANGASSCICEEGSIPSVYNNSQDCALHSDLSIQALARMVDSPSVNDEVLGRNEGRFYEQYRKLRDAKMMEEQQSKRAEREAKLKLMEETLELRKAEMDARTAKLNKDSYHTRARAAKLLALKASLGDVQRVQEEEVNGQSKTLALTKDHTRSDSSPPSAPLTPRALKEQVVTPKLHRAKKAVTSAQKSSTTPRSSARAASASPKTTPKGIVGKASNGRSAISSNIAENPLACSVPCFSDLKKENTKPSPGKPSGPARVPSKNNVAGVHPAVTNRASLLEPNGSVPFQNSSSNKVIRAERKNHAGQNRQSYATAEFKGLATASEDEIPVVLNVQRDAKIEAPLFSKIRRSAVAPIQEVRPFLRKGSGIGPGAGPGVMKLKADAIKSSDEDAPGTPLKNSDEEAPTTMRNITDTSDRENMNMEGTGSKIHLCLSSHLSGEKEVEVETFVASDVEATHHSDGGMLSICEETKLDKPYNDDELFENERACHTISLPIDFVMHERYAATFASELDPASQEPRVEVGRRVGETSATLSQLLSESASQVLQNEPSVNGSASFRATLSADQQSASRFSPMKAASLASSSLKCLGATIPDYFSPSAATLVESPLGSPASWNSSHVQYASETDAIRSQKKSGSAQKPVVMVVPPREPAKGLKRLLKFGRKSRAAPEIIVMDGVSASTPSEGDEDFEDVKELSMHSAQDLLRKVKLQERLLKDFGIAGLSGDHITVQDKGSFKSLQSSIPIPPSNFKLKYDHETGSSKPKASRSFFSLSTFRSRGSEGKSR